MKRPFLVMFDWPGDRAEVEEARREICELVGNLPLAVKLAGSYIASSGMLASEYLEWLQQTGLKALDFGERREESMTILMEKSVEQVSERAKEALAVAGLLALMPFRAEVVAAALEKSTIETQQALGELMNYGLLERTGVRYVVSHPLVHTYARTRMALESKQLLEMADFYNRLIREQSDKGPMGFARLDEERPHIMQLIRVCEKKEEWEVVNDLVWSIKEYLDYQGYSVDRVDALEAGVKAAQARGDRQGEESHLGNLGIAYADLGRVEEAIEIYQQAVEIAQKIGDRLGEGIGLGAIGCAFIDLGKSEQAIDYIHQSQAIYQKIGDKGREQKLRGNLGNAYFTLGQSEQALSCYEQALKFAQEIGDKRDVGHQLGNLGNVNIALGQLAKAKKLQTSIEDCTGYWRQTRRKRRPERFGSHLF